MDFLITREFTDKIQKVGDQKKIYHQDLTIPERLIFLGMQTAWENFVKIKNEAKLKLKKAWDVRHIQRVGDLTKYNRKILETFLDGTSGDHCDSVKGISFVVMENV